VPRKSQVPTYRLHKATGQAVVTIDGHDHYLGLHGSPESKAKYQARSGSSWPVGPKWCKPGP
jgi:hypothetical protein